MGDKRLISCTVDPNYNNGKNWRKCHGNQPDKCVYSRCKFLIIIIRHDTLISLIAEEAGINMKGVQKFLN